MLTRLIRTIRCNEGRGKSSPWQASALKNIVGVFFCLSLVAGSASAQNRQAGSNRSQGVLSIQVYVAPVVISPQAQTVRPQSTDVIYDIPSDRAKFSVTEKLQEQLVTS